MKNLSILFFALTTFQLYAQECKCEQDFDFVVDYYEQNLPAFADNVNENNRPEYENFKWKLRKQAQKYNENKDLCYKTLLTYVEFFKDNHSSIYNSNNISIDENKADEIKAFFDSDIFKNTEQFQNFTPKQNTSISEIENIYQTEDSIYTVAIVKDRNSFRDYVGVIIDSKTPLWKKGQVKFELKQVGDATYDMFYYMKNHSLEFYKNVKLQNGILNDNWFNIRLTSRKNYHLNPYNELTFRELNEHTNYIYLPTFNAYLSAEISAFYQKYDSLIQSKPYLIIDVRNNGGGSDSNAYPLLKYIYTRPFHDDKVEIYATKENTRRWKEWYESIQKDTVNFDPSYVKEVENEVREMEKAEHPTFILRGNEELIHLDSVLTYPKKVAIITNRHCASACETLLFWAKESDKTVILGENSGGYVGYGEVGSVQTPCFGFELSCTLTRYEKQRAYEVDGIPPDHYLTLDKDWIEQAIDWLKSDTEI